MTPQLETLVIPRTSDLGDGVTVRRALPSAQRRMVGPFVFFDEFGPLVFDAGRGLDVRPHPHIGLATVTYLFAGEIVHRDSLGTVQSIRPAEVNWMTAGRGIVHSERTPPALRAGGAPLAGLQVWVALPKQHEEAEPSFAHHGSEALPVIDADGGRLRVVIGEAFGARSPVEVFAETFYVDVALQSGARVQVPPRYAERAAYIVEGELHIGDARFEAGQLLVFAATRDVVLRAGDRPARAVLFGGEAMDGPRHIWWNFVSSSKQRIEQAKADWAARRFDDVPGESEFIPLPGAEPPPVRYP